MNKTIQSYDRYASELAEKFDKLGPRVNDIKKIFSLSKKKNPRVLELGCANGRDAIEIIKYSSNYTGVDASGELLKIAKKRLPQGKFICREFHRLNFPDKSFDIVIEFASIMHYGKDDLEKIFHNIHRWLNIDGLLLISMKQGKYSKFMSRGFGERKQYSYEINDIEKMTKGLFKIIDIGQQNLRGQDWFTIILEKI